MTSEQAIQVAVDHAKLLFGKKGRDFQLEEIEPSVKGGWDITVSFSDLADPASSEANAVAIEGRHTAILGVHGRRHFKAIHVGADGEVKSVRIRTFTVTIP